MMKKVAITKKALTESGFKAAEDDLIRWFWNYRCLVKFIKAGGQV